MIKLIKTIVDDTLKRKKGDKRRFSATRLTMFSAWACVLYTYLNDVIENGFRWESFVLMAGVATGMKVTDAIGKKLNAASNDQ